MCVTALRKFQPSSVVWTVERWMFAVETDGLKVEQAEIKYLF